MPREEFQPNLEALAKEELTGAELREVLKRLSVAEFGGSDHPTVAAVCEATGATPLVIGRMLAEIRQRDIAGALTEKMGRQDRKIEMQARRLDHLETLLQQGAGGDPVELEKARAAKRRFSYDLENPELDPKLRAKIEEELAEQTRLSKLRLKKLKENTWLFIILGLLAFLWLVLYVNRLKLR